MTNKNIKLTGHLLALFSAFVWGITFVSTKVLLEELTAAEILFFRYILGYFALWIVYPHKNPYRGMKNELLYMAAGICGTTIYQFLENTALSLTQASNVSIIVSTAPLFTGIAAWVAFKDKIKHSFILGFVIAMLGIILINFNASYLLKLNPTGDLLALGSAVLWAVYTLLVKIINEKGDSVLGSTRHIFFYGVIFMLPLMAVNGFNSAAFSALLNPTMLLNIAFLGVVASAACFVTWNTAVWQIGAVTASVYIYLIPVITLIFSVTVLDERVGIIGVVGMALVLLGLGISEYKQK